MLHITNLHADVDGKPILKALPLRVNVGEMHAIMGPTEAGHVPNPTKGAV